ncbi:hypothetical protein [Citreicoccus inhibens]|nr:hypothetical protein [Citreicoccus inhibens]
MKARHAQQALRAARETTPAERGEVDAEVVESDDAFLPSASDVSPPADPA